jgi:hypothetical protein
MKRRTDRLTQGTEVLTCGVGQRTDPSSLPPLASLPGTGSSELPPPPMARCGQESCQAPERVTPRTWMRTMQWFAGVVGRWRTAETFSGPANQSCCPPWTPLPHSVDNILVMQVVELHRQERAGGMVVRSILLSHGHRDRREEAA